ncbi:hypothetical protein IF690_00305 [Pseudomonas sp. SK3(2021)]|uniref:hypothetical protein n=1 Tax=Pseudomonas sp. SK3(2021) TaxID=2841064 RepID=UPI00192C2AEA|nr:hypothetical protein [Pseudomonas sp. SK3(2021)]QQZ42019.1 hypothetical protein IF690_00305 [Pseudomonas sp. SK3(2021)]
MNKLYRLAMCLIVHALGCGAYAFLNNAVVVVYKGLNGGFTTRSVAIGIASYALFYIFLTVNLLIALIPNLVVKLGLLCLMVGFILLWMLPDNPIRALFYGVAQGCITLLAILVTQVIELRWVLRTLACRVEQIPPIGDC